MTVLLLSTRWRVCKTTVSDISVHLIVAHNKWDQIHVRSCAKLWILWVAHTREKWFWQLRLRCSHRKWQVCTGTCRRCSVCTCWAESAHVTDPCWRWCCGRAAGWARGRCFGELPWSFLLRRPPTTAPSGPGRRPSFPLWDIDVEARVWGPHDVAGTRVQQDVGGVQSAHSNQTHSIPAGDKISSGVWCVLSFFMCCRFFFHISTLLFVSMKGGKGETLSLVLAEEFTLVQADVMHLIGWAAAVGSVPLVRRARPALPETGRENWLAVWVTLIKRTRQSSQLSIRAALEDLPLKVADVTSYISVRAADRYFSQHGGLGKDCRNNGPQMHTFTRLSGPQFPQGDRAFEAEAQEVTTGNKVVGEVWVWVACDKERII